MNIKYILGDATKPIGNENKIICHIVNSVNKWGKGFVVPLGKKYPIAERSYHSWFKAKENKPTLGAVQFVLVDDNKENIYVANMLAQYGIYPMNNTPPIRYEALRMCLASVAKYCKINNIQTAHMPRIGAGLAGGDWNALTKIITEELCNKNIQVFVYDLKRTSGVEYE